jgi:prophage tail gpP-like protein
MADSDDFDEVTLRLNGEELRIWESYEIRQSILTQPSTFTMRLGWGDVVRDLFAKVRPNTKVQLLINGTLQQTGTIDGFEASGEVGATELTVHGRDALAPLHDAFVRADLSLRDITYFDLVDKALLETVPDALLFGSNEANRRATTGVGVKQSSDPDVTNTTGPTQKILQAKIGERYYEFIKRQLDRAGAFLWAAADGSFILSTPNPNQQPVYRIVRQRGSDRDTVNVLGARYRNTTEMRYTEAIIYGRGGGRISGAVKAKGSFLDEEMIAYGYKRPLVLRDTNVTNAEQGAFYARRKLAETRRQGWNLTYTVQGHSVASLQDGRRATWSVDTIVDVQDDEFGIFGPHYIEAVSFRRGSNGTSTELVLMRPEDLIFGGEG